MSQTHPSPRYPEDYRQQQTHGEHKASLSGQRLVVTYRPIASLIPSPRNARTHSKSQIRKIMNSLRAFGFVNPILISAESMMIAGHGRVEAAKLLGLSEVPTICLEDLSPDQIRAYAIADNRLALDAGWDPALLKIEVLHFDSLPDLDISLLGFEIPELDLIIGEPPMRDDPADHLQPLGSTAIARDGDVWLLGPHKIYCADARDVSAYSRLLGQQKASIVFTDPPYNVVIHGHASGNGQTHHREFAMAAGEMSDTEFTEFLACTLNNLAKASEDGAVHYVAMDWRHVSELLAAAKQVYGSTLNVCVWSKDNGGMGSLYDRSMS